MKKTGRKISVDLSDAEGFKVLPEGPATLTVNKVTEEEGSESGAPYLKWEFDAESEDGSKGKVWENTSLQPQALFKLRGLLEALGYDIPDKALDLDLDELEGLQCGADLEHEEYKGKTKAKVSQYYGLEDAPDEPEEPAPKPKAAAKPAAKGKAAPAAEPEEETEEEAAPAPKTKTKAATKAAAPEIGDKVSFEDDDKEEQIGKVTDVNEEKSEATVKVGKELWTVDFADLTVL